MRSLLLMRHAQTEDSRPGSRDEARRLTPAGREQAAALGDHLRHDRVTLDLIVCSSATRAQQTVEALQPAAPVMVSDQLYNAGADEILALVRDLRDDVAHALLVGHAPALPALVQELADPDTSDADALETIARRFPAGALATMAIGETWGRLRSAALVSVRLPVLDAGQGGTT